MWQWIMDRVLAKRLTLPHVVAMLLGLVAWNVLHKCENAIQEMVVGFLVLSASAVFAGAEVAEALREGNRRGEDRP